NKSNSGPLHDDQAKHRAVEEVDEMGRYARWNLRSNLVETRIKNLARGEPGQGKVESLAVVAEFRVARRFFERYGAHDGARSEVDDDKSEMARLLRCHVGELAVRTDRNGMRLGDRDRSDNSLRRRIEERDL